jgi:hypothetical protein
MGAARQDESPGVCLVARQAADDADDNRTALLVDRVDAKFLIRASGSPREVGPLPKILHISERRDTG